MKTKPKSLSLWKPSTPRLEEFNALLELLPVAAILYSVQHHCILGANSKILRLSAYTQTEINQQLIEGLFPRNKEIDFINHSNQPGNDFISDIATRSGQSIPVVIQVLPLDSQNKWLVISIETQTQRQQTQTKNQRQIVLFSALNEICRIGDSSNRVDVLHSIAQYGSQLAGTGTIAIYQFQKSTYSSDKEALKRVAIHGDDSILPEEIEISDLAQLKASNIWQPGKRISADLHRLARKHSLTYLASTPIRAQDELLGLVIAANIRSEPDEQILQLLEILASSLNSRFELWNSIDNLKKEYIEQSDAFIISQKALENVLDGIILLSSNLDITEMNLSAEQILGYSIHEVYKQPVQNVLIGAGSLYPALQLATDGIETPSLGNVNLHRRDGQAFSAHVQVLPVIKDTTVIGILILFRDLSQENEIKLRTQQLEQRAFLGELTAIFAHEIRNPMNNISLALQMMEIETGEDNPNRMHIERLKQNRDRLIHLMDTVLSFSRSTSYQMVPTDIVNIIERVALRWQPRITREKVETRLQKPSHPIIVNGNDNALEQVFNNLIDNAIRAMRDTNGGILHIRIEVIPGHAGMNHVQITVSDTGPGIPKEYLDKVFQPFFTTDKQNGTGLGLAITQRIIIAHKGKIQVESFSGGGTIFQIQFPTLSSL